MLLSLSVCIVLTLSLTVVQTCPPPSLSDHQLLARSGHRKAKETVLERWAEEGNLFFLKLWFEGTWLFDMKPEEEAISCGTFTKLYKAPESDGLGYNHEPSPRYPVNLDIPVLSHFMLSFLSFKKMFSEQQRNNAVCQTEIIIIFSEISTQCGVRLGTWGEVYPDRWVLPVQLHSQ